jgi:hypothetical protein
LEQNEQQSRIRLIQLHLNGKHQRVHDKPISMEKTDLNALRQKFQSRCDPQARATPLNARDVSLENLFQETSQVLSGFLRFCVNFH